MYTTTTPVSGRFPSLCSLVVAFVVGCFLGGFADQTLMKIFVSFRQCLSCRLDRTFSWEEPDRNNWKTESPNILCHSGELKSGKSAMEDATVAKRCDPNDRRSIVEKFENFHQCLIGKTTKKTTNHKGNHKGIKGREAARKDRQALASCSTRTTTTRLLQRQPTIIIILTMRIPTFLPLRLQRLYASTDRLQQSLQATFRQALQQQSKAEDLIRQSCLYAKWPIEAVAARRGLRLTTTTTTATNTTAGDEKRTKHKLLLLLWMKSCVAFSTTRPAFVWIALNDSPVPTCGSSWKTWKAALLVCTKTNGTIH